MGRYVIIENGIVANVVVAEEAFAAAQGWTEAPAEVSIGWAYDGEAFSAPVLPIAEERAIVTAAIDAARDACFAAGYTVAGTGTALDGKLLQTRDVEDRTNWLTSQAAYSAAVAAGGGAVEEADFRTADNETVTLSYADGLTVLLAMAAWGKAVMGHSWTLKDAALAAEDAEDLAAIDTGAGWP